MVSILYCRNAFTMFRTLMYKGHKGPNNKKRRLAKRSMIFCHWKPSDGTDATNLALELLRSFGETDDDLARNAALKSMSAMALSVRSSIANGDTP